MYIAKDTLKEHPNVTLLDFSLMIILLLVVNNIQLTNGYPFENPFNKSVRYIFNITLKII